eukprot:ctg_603.g275
MSAAKACPLAMSSWSSSAEVADGYTGYVVYVPRSSGSWHRLYVPELYEDELMPCVQCRRPGGCWQDPPTYPMRYAWSEETVETTVYGVEYERLSAWRQWLHRMRHWACM